MSSASQLELISFKTCPFVQRSIIALKEKGVDFTLTHINPAELPDWFKAISPLGKVPVLVVDGQPVFESAVILEYLDEVYLPGLHPAHSLVKAQHRAWMEFASDLKVRFFQMTMAKDEAGFQESFNALQAGIKRLESVVAEDKPFFAGSQFALVDCVYAPLFMRLNLVKKRCGVNIEMNKRLQSWSKTLLERSSVKHSVVHDFEDLFLERLKQQGAYLANQIK